MPRVVCDPCSDGPWPVSIRRDGATDEFLGVTGPGQLRFSLVMGDLTGKKAAESQLQMTHMPSEDGVIVAALRR
jgi:hypothetical protein